MRNTPPRMVTRTSRLRPLAACLALASGACHANPAPPPLSSHLLANFAPSPLPAADLGGFDTLDADADLRAGDRVLYEVQLHDGKHSEQFFALAEVIEPAVQVPFTVTSPAGFDAPRVRSTKIASAKLTTKDGREINATTRFASTRLVILDAAAKELSTTMADLPRDMLRRGFPAACRRALNATPPGSRPEHDAYVQDFLLPLLGLMNLMDLLREDRVLSPYFWRIVQKPFSLSLLFGVRTVLHWNGDSVPAAAMPPELPFRGDAWALPMRVTVNDIAVLDLNLLVTDPASPLSIVGGVLGLEAAHPSNPALRVAMLVRAAKRGPTP